jgi:hypothetical protein
MKKSFVVILSMAVLILVSLAFTQKEEPLYKNLKVLPKNITKLQMDSVMQHFTAALGVKCNFCHMRTEDNKGWNFPSDDNKHKLVAREMIKMTTKINDKYFNVTGAKKLDAKLMVTCYTCHNGKTDPLTRPVRAEAPRRDSTRRN